MPALTGLSNALDGRLRRRFRSELERPTAKAIGSVQAAPALGTNSPFAPGQAARPLVLLHEDNDGVGHEPGTMHPRCDDGVILPSLAAR